MQAQAIQNILIYALPVLFAITVHEAAHGYVARHFGDDTAWRLGRVTLNPFKHIDLMGTIVMPLLLYLSIGIPFGYAKPVPVRFGSLRKPKQQMAWVALAGPGANLAMALVWVLLRMVLPRLGVEEPFFLGMCEAGLRVNMAMFAFNLFPLPPLDGGRVLVSALPMRAAIAVSRVEPYGIFIVLGLIVLSSYTPLDLLELWMRPMMSLGSLLVGLAASPVALLLR